MKQWPYLEMGGGHNDESQGRSLIITTFFHCDSENMTSLSWLTITKRAPSLMQAEKVVERERVEYFIFVKTRF